MLGDGAHPTGDTGPQEVGEKFRLLEGPIAYEQELSDRADADTQRLHGHGRSAGPGVGLVTVNTKQGGARTFEPHGFLQVF